MLRRPQLRYVFRGRPDLAGLEPPLTSPGDRCQIARRMRERADRPRLFPDPLHFVVRHGLVPVELRMPGRMCEYTDGHHIAYPPSLDAREQGGSVYHGLAHCLLIHEGWLATETDAWLLTGELSLPTSVARRLRSLRAAAETQQHAPVWLLALQIMSVRMQAKVA